MPTLDGKALITVESLKAEAGGALHPVQRALVECHGSQCGFCTPGFVMSLYALYRSNRNPDDEAIRHALSGNLCRCTGYRPILAAARKMYEYPRVGDAQDRALKERLLAIRVTREKRLSVGEAEYVAPTTVAELTRALAQRPQATLLAGGTDVGLWVTKKQQELPTIIYLGNVAELKRTRRVDHYTEFGAGGEPHRRLRRAHGGIPRAAGDRAPLRLAADLQRRHALRQHRERLAHRRFHAGAHLPGHERGAAVGDRLARAARSRTSISAT